VTGWQQFAVLAAGFVAGMINVVVGSGTLLTFPTLLAVGIPPVPANVSNSLGLVFGSMTGIWGYRRELRGRRALLRALLPLSLAGGVAGALLLLLLPQTAFVVIVPVLIVIAVLLVWFQPRISVAVARRRSHRTDTDGESHESRGLLRVGVLAAAIYGGYFGAAQGIMLIGLLGSVLLVDLHQVNALKNVLVTVVNAVSVVVFLVVSPATVNWAAAGLLAVGSLFGGLTGSLVGRRLPPTVLRGLIVVVGVVAVIRLVF
jgi:uncharacterized membrane protein YfcA